MCWLVCSQCAGLCQLCVLNVLASVFSMCWLVCSQCAGLCQLCVLNVLACVFQGSKFMRALAEDGAMDEEKLTSQELDSIYTPLREQVSGSLLRQEQILSRIQVRPGGGCSTR